MATAANRECGVDPNPFASSRPTPGLSTLAEGAVQSERDLLAQDVIADAREFMRHGFQGHQRMRPRMLALVKAPDHGLVANGTMRRFDERPA